jgi:squalene-hopene/tetraprenyl-beta-curcumene cyclase
MEDDLKLHESFNSLADMLYSKRGAGDLWEGCLSSSALSTAVAVFALNVVDANKYKSEIDRGLLWLLNNCNSDGGWGDTVRSLSNISTTALCWSALAAYEHRDDCLLAGSRAEEWLKKEVSRLGVSDVTEAVISSYGGDKTFSSPILAMCALSGRLGEGENAWIQVPQLPFELAVLPRKLFRVLNLSVVSYAIPALIAVGLLRHRRMSEASILRYALRNILARPALSLLSRIQPSNGGFLEAVPLTAFVVMSLAGAGGGDSDVVRRGVGFLVSLMREDGSWPIDSNLSVWLTSLSIDALAQGHEKNGLIESDRCALRTCLLQIQNRKKHPYSGSDPGGWSWTHLPGGVPDADDTSGVLIALRRLGVEDDETREAGNMGIKWLLGIQNNDGGMPTFCRGWGKLPFDRSCPDITVHAMRSFHEWYDYVDTSLRSQIDTAMAAAVGYLAESQLADGAWIPLWFGHEQSPGKTNPVYGTAQIVSGLRSMTPGRLPDLDSLIIGGYNWLLAAQNRDGGWGGCNGGPSSIEETALAVHAVSGLGDLQVQERGLEWLFKATNGWTDFDAAPIGLYFASLWYFEDLYPLIFTVRALGRSSSLISSQLK